MNQAIKYIEDIDQMSVIFNSVISKVQEEENHYYIGILPAEREKMWKEMFAGTIMDAAIRTNRSSTEFILTNLVVDYFKSLKEEPNAHPLKVALHLSNREVLVWVVIPDDQDEIESSFYRIEAKMNREYRTLGFSISTTVVEESDGLSIPSQYKEISV